MEELIEAPKSIPSKFATYEPGLHLSRVGTRKKSVGENCVVSCFCVSYFCTEFINYVYARR